jgi:hypothetical protein
MTTSGHRPNFIRRTNRSLHSATLLPPSVPLMAQEKADSGATIAIFLGSASWVVIPPQCEWRDVRSPVLVLIVPRVLPECWDDGLSLSLTKPRSF